METKPKQFAVEALANTYIHTYICQELAQCLQEMNPSISIITLHAGARITRRKMVSHTENNVYIVHSENKCNRAVGSFALNVNLSTFLFSCKRNSDHKNEFTQEACASYTWNLMQFLRVYCAQKKMAKKNKQKKPTKNPHIKVSSK